MEIIKPINLTNKRGYNGETTNEESNKESNKEPNIIKITKNNRNTNQINSTIPNKKQNINNKSYRINEENLFNNKEKDFITKAEELIKQKNIYKTKRKSIPYTLDDSIKELKEKLLLLPEEKKLKLIEYSPYIKELIEKQMMINSGKIIPSSCISTEFSQFSNLSNNIYHRFPNQVCKLSNLGKKIVTNQKKKNLLQSYKTIKSSNISQPNIIIISIYCPNIKPDINSTNNLIKQIKNIIKKTDSDMLIISTTTELSFMQRYGGEFNIIHLIKEELKDIIISQSKIEKTIKIDDKNHRLRVRAFKIDKSKLLKNINNNINLFTKNMMNISNTNTRNNYKNVLFTKNNSSNNVKLEFGNNLLIKFGYFPENLKTVKRNLNINRNRNRKLSLNVSFCNNNNECLEGRINTSTLLNNIRKSGVIITMPDSENKINIASTNIKGEIYKGRIDIVRINPLNRNNSQ